MTPSPEFLILLAIIGALSAIVLWLLGDIREQAEQVRELHGELEKEIEFNYTLEDVKRAIGGEPASPRELLERKP